MYLNLLFITVTFFFTDIKFIFYSSRASIVTIENYLCILLTKTYCFNLLISIFNFFIFDIFLQNENLPCDFFLIIPKITLVIEYICTPQIFVK